MQLMSNCLDLVPSVIAEKVNIQLDSVCWAKEATCHYCHEKGHIVRVCRTKQNHRSPGKLSVKTNLVQTVTKSNEDYSLFTLGSTHSPPSRVEVYLDQQPVSMQVDTGAAVSVISRNVFQSVWDSPSLMKSDVKLQSYRREQIGAIGCFTTSVSHKGQKQDLPLLVVEGSGPSLLSRNWLSSLCLNWREMNILQSGSSAVESLLANYADLFQPELGTFQRTTVDLRVSPDAQPKFFKARAVP